MAWTAPSTWVAGAILTAAQLNTQLRDNMLCGGPIYATEAARDTAITSPFEGQRAYITGPTIPAATGGTTMIPSGITTVYNGSVWVCTTEVGALTSTTGTLTNSTFTPTLTSGGTNPSVTLVTGTTALVMMSVIIANDTTGSTSQMDVAVSGATTLAAGNTLVSVQPATANKHITLTQATVLSGLTAGTNTFTLQYNNSSISTTTFLNRRVTIKGIA